MTSAHKLEWQKLPTGFQIEYSPKSVVLSLSN